jgi:prevent-host-death family protein
MSWTLQDAKQRFSELVRRTLEEGPQVVTRHGREVVVIVPAGEYERLARDPNGDASREAKDYLLAGPELPELDIRRDAAPATPVELARFDQL